MKYLFVVVLLAGFLITPAFAQDMKNPSVIIDTIEIPAVEFNRVLRDAPIIPLDDIHGVSWHVTSCCVDTRGHWFQGRGITNKTADAGGSIEVKVGNNNSLLSTLHSICHFDTEWIIQRDSLC